MSRPTDWSAVDRDRDPTPGDSAASAALARRYQNTADEIDRQATALRRLSSSAAEIWDSDASKVFALHAEALAGNITKAHGRYAVAAAALRGWAEPSGAYGGLSPLEAAQQKADAALAQAQQAHADLQANSPQPAPTAAPGQTDPDPQAVAAHRQREAAYADAQTSLRRAILAVGDAEEDYDTAARAAAAQIDAVSHHDALHDSFWDGVSGWIHDHAAMIKSMIKIIGWVVTALAVAALVASLFVPGLDILGGALLADILENLAADGAGLMLLGHSLLAANGDGSWLDVGFDLLALAGFCGGRALSRGIADAAEGAVGPAAEAAASRAAQRYLEDNAKAIARWTMASRIPLLRTLLGASARLDAFDAGAAQASDDARQAVLNLPKVTTTVWDRVTSGGPEAAQGLAKLKQLSSAVPGVPEVEGAMSTAAGSAARNATLRYGLLGVDLANHDIEETTDWKQLLEPYATYPVLPLPWQDLAPAGDGR